ncbi:MAG: hypothetical protein RL417_1551 [Pseudomonadota bacterium]|jgi:soluble lytic murein transglycosylase-like protein
MAERKITGWFKGGAFCSRASFGAIPFFVTFFLAGTGLAGPIYVIEEAGGVKRFTNKAPPPGVAAKVFTAKRLGFSVYKGIPGRKARHTVSKYEAAIAVAANAHRVPIPLVKAVMHVESAFNAAAISRKGAMGLMQLMPETARDMGVKSPLDPTENIRGGVKYLAFLLSRYGGDKVKSIAAYNAGPGAVDKYGGIPPFAETRQYVRDVLFMEGEYARKTSPRKR